MGKRNDSLDYLRGLLAVGVMGYHYSLVTTGLWAKLGLYAVEAFFVLSGLVLASLYRFDTANEFKAYLTKRVFRIAPLFWVATAWTLWLTQRPVPHAQIASNLLLTFGWDGIYPAIPKGGWSIGLEMVFYVALPVMLLTGLRWWLIGCALYAFGWVAFTMPEAWGRGAWMDYVRPFNHMVFFVAGVAMGRYPVKISRGALLALLAACIAIFCAWPASALIEMAAGVGRIILSLCCIGVVFAIYNLSPQFNGATAAVLAFLGRGSYSIYLLHPLVLLTLKDVWLAASVTLALSAVSYTLLEKPLMRVGARLAERLRHDQPIFQRKRTEQGAWRGDARRSNR